MDDPLILAAEAFAVPRYREPHRAYHDEAHIRAVLGALAERGVLTVELALAAWGHDLVYDPTAHDNEEKSAEAFDRWLAGHGAGTAMRERVGALILATRHAAPPTDREEALLVDADLSVLGASEPVFDAYDRAIRLEYGHVPEAAYRLGRAKVLQSILDRTRIFKTPEFASLEAPARRNLARALTKLAG
jgi:predicted metal-dependent HD superfamily phosphohydrolase